MSVKSSSLASIVIIVSVLLYLTPSWQFIVNSLHASIACGNWLEFKNNNSYILSIDQPRTSLRRSMGMFVQRNPIITLSCCTGTNFTLCKFRN